MCLCPQQPAKCLFCPWQNAGTMSLLSLILSLRGGFTHFVKRVLYVASKNSTRIFCGNIPPPTPPNQPPRHKPTTYSTPLAHFYSMPALLTPLSYMRSTILMSNRQFPHSTAWRSCHISTTMSPPIRTQPSPIHSKQYGFASLQCCILFVSQILP